MIKHISYSLHQESSRVMNVQLIDGKSLMNVSETKFVGVIIDNKLSWKPHIRYVWTKVAKRIGIRLKARKVFNHETLSTLYYTFVYPYLHRCIHVWGRAYNAHLKDICVSQTKIIRIINVIPPRTNIDHLYIQHNIHASWNLSSAKLKIRIRIIPVNLRQNIYVWFF